MKDNGAESETEKGGLMFAWHRKQSLFVYLIIFGAVSLIIHLLGFYLFQVVYPASGRLEPEPFRVTLLNSSQPAVNALLRKVEDRLVYLRPASSGSEVRVSLGDYSAQFEASFSERRVNFKSTAPVAAIRHSASAGMADPLAPAQAHSLKLELPPVQVAPARNRASKERIGDERWRISGDLGDRTLVDVEAFETLLPELGAPPAVRLRIGVGSNGSVRLHLPVAGQGHPLIGEISEAVRTGLRFAPKPGSEMEWGWLEIRR